MDRNELNLKIETLKVAMNEHDYEKAAEIADELELKKLKDNNLLSLVADTYEMCHEYDKSKEALLCAYENTNAGRQLAYRLCLISIKTKEFDDAEEFYQDFIEMAPRDTSRYILKYKMSKAKGTSTERLIHILEEYVNLDMEEQWAYELAKLYHLVGDQEKCIDMCDEISLWFSEGKYVLKALELKQQYQPLSALQKQKYEQGKQKKMEKALEQEDTFVKNEFIEQTENIPAENTSVENTVQIPGIIENEIEELTEGAIDKVEDIALEKIDDKEETLIKLTGKISEEQMEKITAEENAAKETAPEEQKSEFLKENQDIEEITEVKEEAAPIKNLGDIGDILRQLQERGVLKAETVKQAVTIIEEAGNEENEELDRELAKIDEDADADKSDIEGNNENNEVEETSGKTRIIPDLNDLKETSLGENEEDIPEEIDVAIQEQSKEENVSSAPLNTDNIPVLDLGFDAPKPDKAEEKSATTSDMVATSNLSADVEVISGIEKKSDENTAPLDIIKEEAKEELKEKIGITLSEEDLAAFKNYLNIEGLESDIKETVEGLVNHYVPDGKSTSENVIIMGDEKTGKTTLAIEIIKMANLKRGRRDRKLAKISAEALNKRGFKNSISRLLGCDLIIENAHKLGAMTLSEIMDTSGMFTDDMLMILEGEIEGLQTLIQNSPRVSEVFNHLIQIREYDVKEWVEYGKRYAKEWGFVMDELASLAFYKAIDDCFGENKGIGREDVESILEEAMSKGRKKIFGSKKDDDGFIVLTEKNFK